ncbi:MAG: MFS transporter [Planctomycetes bacterium]|nr:MFS transporter [Planctomycetota bacterium]MDA8376248.1 MFS transporter [Planctomycetia bacterium]
MRKASILTIFLIVFVDLVGFGIVLPNLQLYGQQFGISNYFYLTLIGAIYSFFQFIFAPILGRWSDHIGRRPVLIVSQIGTIIGFVMLFAANFFQAQALGIVLIFASRVLDGISGGNISTANAYIADITTPENRAKGMGALGAAFGLGFIFGPIIGGVVSNFLGLQYVPLVAAAFSCTALLLTCTQLAESRTPNNQRNDAAARRFSFRGMEHALVRPIIGPLILLFFVNGFAFAGMEQTLSLLIQQRMYPITRKAMARQVAQRQMAAAGAGVTRPELKTTPQMLTAFRKKQDDHSSYASGWLYGAIGIVMVLIQGGMIGRLTRKYGELKLTLLGPVIIAAGLIIIGLPPVYWHWTWRWTGFLAGGILLAVGSGLFSPSMQALISRHCTADEQGEVLGANQGMASLARALGPILAGLLFEYMFPAMPYYVSAGLCLLVTAGIFINRTNFALPAPATAAVLPDALPSK